VGSSGPVAMAEGERRQIRR